MNKVLTITVLFVLAAVLMTGAPAQAQNIFDITFDPGAEPLTYGFLCLGACDGTGSEDPSTNPISINPLDGSWQHVNTSGGGGVLWGVGRSHGLPNEFSSLFPGATKISGFASLRLNSNPDLRQTAQAIGLPNIGFLVGVTETAIGWAKCEGCEINVLGTINNPVGEFHEVGWELDIPTTTATAFFDGVQMGEPFDVQGEHASYLNDFYMFGSGRAGTVDITWDRAVVNIGEFTGGPVPAPPRDFTWNVNSFGEWTTASPNWTPTGGPPGDPGAVGFANHSATFGSKIMSNRTVITETAVSVRAITFDNSSTYNIAGTGSVNLNAATDTSLPTEIVVVQGTHQFQADVNLYTDTTVDVADNSTLIFDNSLDLNNSVLTKTGDGELAIRNDFLTSGGTLNCAQGTCSGSGTISGDLINDGGTISPGNSSDSASAVPEPTALVLVMIGAGLFAFRRTFRRKGYAQPES